MKFDTKFDMKNMGTKNKVLIFLVVLAFVFIVWQVYGMFSSSPGSAEVQKASSAKIDRGIPNAVSNVTAQASSPIPAQVETGGHAPVVANANDLAPSNEQSQYMQLIGQYQLLKMKRMLLEEEVAIASARQKIADLNAKTGDLGGDVGSADIGGDVDMASSNAAGGYKVVFIDRQNGEWDATLSKGGRFEDVSVGSELADGTQVISIDAKAVVIKRGAKLTRLSFSGATSLEDKSPDVRSVENASLEKGANVSAKGEAVAPKPPEQFKKQVDPVPQTISNSNQDGRSADSAKKKKLAKSDIKSDDKSEKAVTKTASLVQQKSTTATTTPKASSLLVDKPASTVAAPPAALPAAATPTATEVTSVSAATTATTKASPVTTSVTAATTPTIATAVAVGAATTPAAAAAAAISTTTATTNAAAQAPTDSKSSLSDSNLTSKANIVGIKLISVQPPSIKEVLKKPQDNAAFLSEKNSADKAKKRDVIVEKADIKNVPVLKMFAEPNNLPEDKNSHDSAKTKSNLQPKNNDVAVKPSLDKSQVGFIAKFMEAGKKIWSRDNTEQVDVKQIDTKQVDKKQAEQKQTDTKPTDVKQSGAEVKNVKPQDSKDTKSRDTKEIKVQQIKTVKDQGASALDKKVEKVVKNDGVKKQEIKLHTKKFNPNKDGGDVVAKEQSASKSGEQQQKSVVGESTPKNDVLSVPKAGSTNAILEAGKEILWQQSVKRRVNQQKEDVKAMPVKKEMPAEMAATVNSAGGAGSGDTHELKISTVKSKSGEIGKNTKEKEVVKNVQDNSSSKQQDNKGETKLESKSKSDNTVIKSSSGNGQTGFIAKFMEAGKKIWSQNDAKATDVKATNAKVVDSKTVNVKEADVKTTDAKLANEKVIDVKKIDVKTTDVKQNIMVKSPKTLGIGVNKAAETNKRDANDLKKEIVDKSLGDKSQEIKLAKQKQLEVKVAKNQEQQTSLVQSKQDKPTKQNDNVAKNDEVAKRDEIKDLLSELQKTEVEKQIKNVQHPIDTQKVVKSSSVNNTSNYSEPVLIINK